MRIAVNGWFWNQLATGSGQYLEALVDRLPEVSPGHEWALVLPSRSRPTSEERCVPPPWRSVEEHIWMHGVSENLAKVWFEQLAFPAVCRRIRADIALVPYWGSPWWRPCPVVVTIHDLIPLLLPLYRGGPLQRLYTWMVSRTARRAQAALTDSQASRRDIIAALGIAPGCVHAVHLGVEPRFHPVDDPNELARVRARYGLPEQPFFLYLGGFDARKNVSRTVRAYAALLGKMGQEAAGPGSGRLPVGSARLSIQSQGEQQRVASLPRLVVAGKLPGVDSPFSPDPRPLVASLGLDQLVHFTGWVDEADKPALYSLALAALFVSEYEGFGLPVLEAQACGCPVITAQAHLTSSR